MGNRGTVHAFDKDPRRLARLQRNAAAAGATAISARCADFLTLDPEAPEFAQARRNCSGTVQGLPWHREGSAGVHAPGLLCTGSTARPLLANRRA